MKSCDVDKHVFCIHSDCNKYNLDYFIARAIHFGGWQIAYDGEDFCVLYKEKK